jgi:hypothetical protein
LTLPLTIEVAQDVPIKTSERRSDGSNGQERGVLYSTEAFRIGRGQTFEMTAVLREGGCRIRFQGEEHEPSSCPWLPGFADRQADIFQIVPADPYL